MTQMMMFDPRETPTATAEMLADDRLKKAIATMRRRDAISKAPRRAATAPKQWPYVEAIVGAVPAWVVDDGGLRYIVVGSMVFEEADLEILNFHTREAARSMFDRFDAQVAA
jgi:hypothetical protein